MLDTITLSIEKAARFYSLPTISLFGYDNKGYPELITSSYVAEDIADRFRFEFSENMFAGLEIRVNGVAIELW